MSNEINLKARNTPILWVFFTFNITLFTSFLFANLKLELVSDLGSILTIRTTSVVVAPLILFAINGLLSPDLKVIIVFWKLKNVLPGCRAFSELAQKDFRVDVNKLIISHGQLPTAAKTQNELWYKLYKLNKDDLVIQISHGKFLLGRDLTSMSFLFLIFVGLPFLIVGKFPINFIYFLVLVFLYLILMIVTRNHGNRFVTNVLALESSK
ncbi:hypothetical protein AB9T89_12890 [Flavobacterium oncorhynchi]|uniref:hypothetical protein n=1 Tax=Flavobacterium oncorhynchi TaxID=728056 RepID=UPI00351A380C